MRRIWTSEDLNGYLAFPNVRQVFRIDRLVTQLKTGKQTEEICYGLTSLDAAEADPPTVLGHNRRHWEIETRLHWVRDMDYDEDRSQVRKENGPQVMATLRNLSVALLRLAGATNIAAAIRHMANRPDKAVRLLGR